MCNAKARFVPNRGREVVTGAEAADAAVVRRTHLCDSYIDGYIRLQVSHDSRIVQRQQVSPAGGHSRPDGRRHEISSLPARWMQAEVVCFVDSREVDAHKSHARCSRGIALQLLEERLALSRDTRHKNVHARLQPRRDFCSTAVVECYGHLLDGPQPERGVAFDHDGFSNGCSESQYCRLTRALLQARGALDCLADRND